MNVLTGKLILLRMFFLTTACLCLLSGCGNAGGSYVQEGYGAIEAGDYDLAITNFQAALEEQGKDRMALRGLGIAQIGKASYTEAVASLEEALSCGGFFPEQLDYDINFYLATAYYKSGDVEEALKICNAVLGLSPNNRDALFLRGSIRLKQQDAENACLDFERSIELDPNDMEGLISISELLTRSGYPQLALEYLEDAMGRADSNSMSDFDRGRICYYEGDYENARTYLEKSRDSGNPDTALFLGRTYEQLGDYNYASSVYTSYLTGNTSNAEIHNQLGLCRMHQGMYEDALSSFENGLQAEDSGCRQELMFNAVCALEYLGRFEEARQRLEEYLSLYPEDETANREYVFLKSR